LKFFKTKHPYTKSSREAKNLVRGFLLTWRKMCVKYITTMTKGQRSVQDFMEFFGQKIPSLPTKLSFEESKLRANLILEEVFETITKGLGLRVFINEGNNDLTIHEGNLKSIEISYFKDKDTDLVELADGVGDIFYVSEGTASAAGIDMEPVHEEIHSSNMSKAWTAADLQQAKEMYPDATVEHYGGELYRLKRPDGKIIKSPNYKPANIKRIIDKQIVAPDQKALEKLTLKQALNELIECPA
jgi:predicted HAD superfamily Cof-like phosphohydrolase